MDIASPAPSHGDVGELSVSDRKYVPKEGDKGVADQSQGVDGDKGIKAEIHDVEGEVEIEVDENNNDNALYNSSNRDDNFRHDIGRKNSHFRYSNIDAECNEDNFHRILEMNPDRVIDCKVSIKDCNSSGAGIISFNSSNSEFINESRTITSDTISSLPISMECRRSDRAEDTEQSGGVEDSEDSEVPGAPKEVKGKSLFNLKGFILDI